MELTCVLSLDNLPVLQNELHDIRHKWYNFGIQLGLDNGTLQAIKSEFTDNGDALREVLISWLKMSPTWISLDNALRSRPVAESGIADMINSSSSASSATHEVRHCSHYMDAPSMSAKKSQRQQQLQVYSNDSGTRLATMSSPISTLTGGANNSEVFEYQTLLPAEGPLQPPITLMDSKFTMMKMPSTKNSMKCDYKFKVVIVGESGVGKTSILNRFLKPETPVSSTRVTVEPIKPEGNVVIKVTHDHLHDLYVRLSIWDTAGMERLFNYIPDQTFRHMDAALIVFDVSLKSSYMRAVSDTRPRAESGPLSFGRRTNSNAQTQRSWIKMVNNKAGDIPPVKILVGNMIDKDSRQVSETDASEMASRLEMQYIETSSLEHINIDKIFFTVTDLLLDRAAKFTARRSSGGMKLTHQKTTRSKPKCRC